MWDTKTLPSPIRVSLTAVPSSEHRRRVPPGRASCRRLLFVGAVAMWLAAPVGASAQTAGLAPQTVHSPSSTGGLAPRTVYPATSSSGPYSGRDFAGFAPETAPSAANTPNYGGSAGVASYANVASHSPEYQYSKDAWRRPMPSSRGVFAGGGTADPSSGSRPLIPVDESISASELRKAREKDDYSHFNDFKSGFFYLFGQGPDEDVADNYFREGMEHYAAGRYATAADRFGWAEFRSPVSSPRKEESLYMKAESHFFAGNYVSAQKGYIDLLSKYDHPRRRDVIVRRMFAIARFWDHLDAEVNQSPINIADRRQPWLGTFSAAMRTYEKIWTHDPLGDLADDSLMASGSSYMRKRRLNEAATNFQFLRQEHANSEHLLNAYKYEIYCRRTMYQGPGYDGKTLDRAGKLIDQALVQFGSQIGPDRELLINAKNEVREAKAERDWAIAQYYDNKKMYGAARYYYECIPREFPESRFAEMARRRHEEIADLPAEPSKFAWITDIFLPEQTVRR